jgi:hypothetical protein
MQKENTVYPNAALPSLALETLTRNIALQSATAPSLREAQNATIVTTSKGPFGNIYIGLFLC